MEFPERLAALRNERGLSQEKMASIAGVHASQLRRYEAGMSQPTLEVLRRICVGLGISADLLLFDEGERANSDLVHIADAAGVLDAEEKAIAAGVIDALVYKHQAEARRKARQKPGRKPAAPPKSAKATRTTKAAKKPRGTRKAT